MTKEFKIVTGKELLEMEVKKTPFIVDQIIPERAITAITANSGSGKSLLTLIMSRHIALGAPLFDLYKTKKSKILIIDQEMNEETIVSRYQSIVGLDLDIHFIHDQSFKIDNNADYAELKNKIIDRDYNVLILDTFNTIHNKIENDSGDMKLVNDLLLKLIRETDVTIIYLHHNRKETNGQAQGKHSSRGSTEIIAKVSSLLMIKSERGEKINDDRSTITTYTLSQEKSRAPGKFKTIKLKVAYNEEENKTSYSDFKEVDQSSRDDSKIQEVICELLKDNVFSIASILDKLKDRQEEITESRLRKILSKMIRSKLLKTEKGSSKQHNTNFYSLM